MNVKSSKIIGDLKREDRERERGRNQKSEFVAAVVAKALEY